MHLQTEIFWQSYEMNNDFLKCYTTFPGHDQAVNELS